MDSSADPVVIRQKNEMESLIGSWSDKRATCEIIDDIYAARSLGRDKRGHSRRLEGGFPS